MEANIINAGNSKGIIIPSKFLKLLGLNKKVNIGIINNKIIISSIDKQVRDGWEEMIINDIEINGQPKRLIPDFFEDEIYWTNLNSTQGSEINKTRPCVVISPNVSNKYLNTVIVAPVTSTVRKIPTRIDVIINDKKGQIVLDQIRCYHQ